MAVPFTFDFPNLPTSHLHIITAFSYQQINLFSFSDATR
jgi:hypothetical protein